MNLSLVKKWSSSLPLSCLQTLFGAFFLAGMAQLSLPLYPVPLTMQVLGVFMLGMIQGGKRAFASTLLYLLFISLGLPFLAGAASNPLWLALPQAGYLAAFPFAAFIVGALTERRADPSSMRLLLALLVGELFIFSSGILGLTRLFSLKQALMVGLFPFLPVEGLKILIALLFGGVFLRWKRKVQKGY